MTESEIISEITQLRVLYVLKQEIRYHFSRHEEIETESVAEHIYGMLVVANYFLPRENPAGDWDRAKIYDLITYHDIDEIETGDTIGYLKPNDHLCIEVAASQQVIEQLPEAMQSHITERIDEYARQETIESQFVRAVDKFEPIVHLLCDNGMKTTHFHKTTFEQHMSIKRPALQPFPIMLHYNEVLGAYMQNKGYFTT